MTSTHATGCANGYYNAVTTSNQQTCVVCPSGKYLAAASWSGSATTCTDCPNGMETASAAAACTTKTGYAGGSFPSTHATGCANGYYNAVVTSNQETCVVCPSGKYLAAASWSGSATTCTDCPNGMETASAGAACTDSTGYAGGSWPSTHATGCAANYRWMSGAASAAVCTACGDMTGCAANTVQTAGTNAATAVCTACRSGIGATKAAAALVSSTSATTNKCVAAGYQNPSGCAANYYQASGTTGANGVCTACAAGQVLATANFGASATSCSSGNTCTSATGTGCAALTGCAANYVQTEGTSAADAKCVACPSGATRSAGLFGAVSATANICVKAGYVFTAGSATPTGCAKDYYQSAGTNAATGVCTACAAGTQLAAAAFGAAVTTCVTGNTCTTGTATCCSPATGAATVTGCAANYYQSAPSSSGTVAK